MWILFLLLMTGLAQADVYVLTNSDNSVIGLSEQNDMVVPQGDKVSTVKGNISNLPINGDVKMYTFSKGAFTLNTSKVQAQQAAQQAGIAAQTAEINAKASAIAKIQAALAAASQDTLTDAEIKAIIP